MRKTTTTGLDPQIQRRRGSHPVDVYSDRRQQQYKHDIQFQPLCQTRAGDLKLRKSSSESSEDTIADSEVAWAPPSTLSRHPPHRGLNEFELDSCKPFWIPYPNSPAERNTRPRTLVLCFDGTGDQFDDDNSNVVQFLACLKKNDKDRQLVYYQTGIGTTTTPNFITPVVNQISKTLDSMFAWNLSSHVQDGYQFLVQNYKARDRISIFGFSRGAYTARALAGMIQRVGILPADNTQQIPFAWNMYIRDDENAEKESAEYKRTFSTNVIVDFVGVWDTVASVGLTGKELPFVRSNTAIRVFRHALALDEHRAKFMPNFYHAGNSDQSVSTNQQSTSESNVPRSIESTAAPPQVDKDPDMPNVYPKKDRNTPADVCEVWFAGCHSDVGGGSVRNGTAHALARIPMRWMIRECYRMKTGIIFDARLLHSEFGLDYRKLYPEVLERPSRIPWSKYMGPIQETEPQGWGIVTFTKFLVLLIAIPIRILFAIITWPLLHTWLLLKYTKWMKCVRKRHMKRVRRNLGVDWLVSKAKSYRSWVYSKLFPKENTTPEPCTLGCNDEEEHEYWDALSPIYDQLKIRWFWKVIEYLPLRFVEHKKRYDDYYVAFNRGKGRKIHGDACCKHVDTSKPAATDGTKDGDDRDTNGVLEVTAGIVATDPVIAHALGTYRKAGSLKVHRSVLTRLEADAAYRPAAWWSRREVGGAGRKGPVVLGPDSWNIQDPDPVEQWEWVE